MKIKRFLARDLPAATQLIKKEFGLAAIILAQRELPAEEGGGVEITAGVRDEDLPTALVAEGAKKQNAPAAVSSKPKPKAGPGSGAAAYLKSAQVSPTEPTSPPCNLKAEDLKALERSLGHGLDELKNLILDLAHRQSLAEKWRDRADLVALYRRLLATALAPEPARILVELAAESAAAWGGEVADHLRRALRPKVRVLDLTQMPPKALALVGPSGAGKTTTLVNLAAFYRQRGYSVAAITLDTLRLGGAEQLTQYARILGFGLRVCQNQEEFSEALELFENDDLILIDTPARAFQKSDGRHELNGYFTTAGAAALLVLPATMKEGDLLVACQRSQDFKEAGVVLTKFDETETLGALVGLILGSTPRLAFFSLGPKASEDFILADQDKFLDLWLGESVAAKSEADQAFHSETLK